MRALAAPGIAALSLAALALTACRYGAAAPPRLDEAVRVTVVINDARLVRAQAALQSAVARALEQRLGWRIDPRGTARLDLTLREERLASTGTAERDLPARWSITLHGNALLVSRHGNDLGSFVGTGYASGLADEPEALDEAAREAAAQVAGWLITAGERWGRPGAAPAEPPPPSTDPSLERAGATTDAPTGEGRDSRR